MGMIEIRHSLDAHIRKNFNWHGGGVDLTTGNMDVTFDHDGREYKILLTDVGESSA